MKSNLFRINSLKAIAMLILSTFFAINVMAQTSVTITVNPNPTITAAEMPVSHCPDPDAEPAYTEYTFTLADANAVAVVSTGTAIVQYCTDENFEEGTLLDEDYEVTVSAGQTSATYYARAYVAATTCYSEPIPLSFHVYVFPNLAILPVSAICAGSKGIYYASAPARDASVTNYTWTVVGGTPATQTGTDNSIEITWNESTTGFTGKITLVYTTADGCNFEVTQDVQVDPKPEVTTQDIATCNGVAIRLYAGIKDIVPTPEEDIFTFSLNADMSNPITTADAFIPTKATTTIYVRAKVGDCDSDIESFTLTMYDAIDPVLGVVEGNETSTDYEECSNNPENTANEITLKVTVTGGCPDATSYTVAWSATGLTPASGTVTVSKTAGANEGTATFKVNVPADGAAYTVELDYVQETGACGCTWGEIPLN